MTSRMHLKGWGTQEIWELFKKGQYEIYISDVVLYEINKCSREKREILLDYLDQIEYTIIETDEDSEYNAARYEHMTPAEIVADTKAGAAELLEIMKKRKLTKV